ncbi:hypothetical protein F5Y05DRAFT_29283 [Hypoxylon sp. FL0543]|nr:hypothetical protein F5Y05DRAFT_29283 [Hypoxylon sp. FL0543]
MKGTRSLGHILTAALALAPLASAWPGWLPDVDTLVVRQDDGSSTADATPTSSAAPKPTESSTDDQATSSADSDEPKTTNLNTAKVTSDPTNTKGGDGSTATGNSTTKATHSTFNPQDGAGGVAMITPATTDGTTLYRIGDPTPITWVWNYTSLQGTPTAIDVLVSCSTATETWTLTQNMTFEPTATFTWDTLNYSNSEDAIASPLLVAQYTLVIYDADSSPDATAEAGYLAPYDGFQFGLYTARPYQDLGEWKCATCSGALGAAERQALGLVISMSIITVLSFTWYVTGFAGLL